MSIQLIRTEFKKLYHSWEDSIYQDFCEGLDVIAHGKSLRSEDAVSASIKAGKHLATGTVTKGVLKESTSLEERKVFMEQVGIRGYFYFINKMITSLIR